MESTCECNYHLGLGPNLKCQIHCEANRRSCASAGSATGHAGDCTIYASLVNMTPLDGICTCGYGWECVRRGDWDKMFSEEWLEANKSPNDQIRHGGPETQD